MPSIDAPDWQRVIVTVQASGDVPDAPDWERIVVGPGGTPVGPTPGGISTTSYYYALGYLGLTVDPTVTNATSSHAAGLVSLNAFTAFASATAGFVTLQVNSAASVTANQNYVGIYDSGQASAGRGTLLATSAAGACDAVFNSNGVHKIALSTTVNLVAGQMYYAAFLNNGGTPGFQNCSLVNPNTGAINPLGTTFPTRYDPAGSFTTLPATAPFAGSTLQAGPWLMFIS